MSLLTDWSFAPQNSEFAFACTFTVRCNVTAAVILVTFSEILFGVTSH
jgi:hypothetical protein